MNNRKYLLSFLILTLLGVGACFGQNDNSKISCLNERQLKKKSTTVEDNSQYVLHIKLKKKPNSRKVEIISLNYKKKPSKTFEILMEQKKRILEIEENKKKKNTTCK
ncbi:hypothetical protein [Tenacibaculum agarivorans]|uniref:hypothetical protein n=1 Tax=Tenacibaculum agarivorans TaxID=1908389 RepID=UPI00094B8583|nr:hypothetical protein [Tenacibaculum agarivorans]